MQIHPGIRLWRRFARSAPEKQAFRSTSGECEPDSVALCARSAVQIVMTPTKERKTASRMGYRFLLEATPRFELGVEVLQTLKKLYAHLKNPL